MTSRLFVAVVPPQRVREELDAFLAPRRDAAADLRWTLPEGWHLTCAFLPTVPEAREDDLVAALAEVAARSAPFGLTVEGAGAFPHPDRAKVLWWGVSEGAEQLAALARRSRNAAHRLGLAVDGARFHAHLTVARTNGISATNWLTVLGSIDPVSWPVQQLELIRSLGLPGGAGYRSVARFDLLG